MSYQVQPVCRTVVIDLGFNMGSMQSPTSRAQSYRNGMCWGCSLSLEHLSAGDLGCCGWVVAWQFGMEKN